MDTLDPNLEVIQHYADHINEAIIQTTINYVDFRTPIGSLLNQQLGAYVSFTVVDQVNQTPYKDCLVMVAADREGFRAYLMTNSSNVDKIQRVDITENQSMSEYIKRGRAILEQFKFPTLSEEQRKAILERQKEIREKMQSQSNSDSSDANK